MTDTLQAVKREVKDERATTLEHEVSNGNNPEVKMEDEPSIKREPSGDEDWNHGDREENISGKGNKPKRVEMTETSDGE